MFRFRKKKLSEVIENFKLIFDVGSGWSLVRLSRRTVDAEDRGIKFSLDGSSMRLSLMLVFGGPVLLG